MRLKKLVERLKSIRWSYMIGRCNILHPLESQNRLSVEREAFALALSATKGHSFENLVWREETFESTQQSAQMCYNKNPWLQLFTLITQSELARAKFSELLYVRYTCRQEVIVSNLLNTVFGKEVNQEPDNRTIT